MADTTLKCPGCGLGGFGVAKEGIPSRSYYIHCLFKCFDYLKLNLAKSCLNCNVLLLNQEELNLHKEECVPRNVSSHETSQYETDKTDNESTDEKEEEVKKSPNVCSYCSIKFSHKRDLQCHTSCKHKCIKCPSCIKVYNPSSNLCGSKHINHFRKHEHFKEKYLKTISIRNDPLNDFRSYFVVSKCVLCDKDVLGQMRSLRGHFERHIGHQYRCRLCKALAATITDFQYHIRTEHPGHKVKIPNPVWVVVDTK